MPASETVTVIAELPDGAMSADAGGRDRLGPSAARLQIRPLQDQEEGRENGALRADVSIAVGDVAAARKAFAPAPISSTA